MGDMIQETIHDGRPAGGWRLGPIGSRLPSPAASLGGAAGLLFHSAAHVGTILFTFVR
jgi:hypothetical protein